MFNVHKSKPVRLRRELALVPGAVSGWAVYETDDPLSLQPTTRIALPAAQNPVLGDQYIPGGRFRAGAVHLQGSTLVQPFASHELNHT
jgi:hypothetical protein